MTGREADIIHDYTENYMTIRQLVNKYYPEWRDYEGAIRELLREQGLLRKRGSYMPTKTFGDRRTCSTCGVEKVLAEDFYKDKTKAAGYQHICKGCKKNGKPKAA
jgi:hypothetical protein